MSEQLVLDSLKYLGRRATDRITTSNGVIIGVCFDVNGCIECSMHRGLDKDNKPYEVYWYSIQRLEIDMTQPAVLNPPDYTMVPRLIEPPSYPHGANEKPTRKA